MSAFEVGSVEAFIDAMHRRGLKLNNLFELDDGTWQANVRSEKGHEFGRAGNPRDAMMEALLAAVRAGMEMPVGKPPLKRGLIIVNRAVKKI